MVNNLEKAEIDVVSPWYPQRWAWVICKWDVLFKDLGHPLVSLSIRILEQVTISYWDKPGMCEIKSEMTREETSYGGEGEETFMLKELSRSVNKGENEHAFTFK